VEQAWITGVGVVSPLGVGMAALTDGLRAGRRCFGPPRWLDPGELVDLAVAEVAEIPRVGSLPGLSRHPRATRLARAALVEALAQAGLDGPLGEAGLFLGTSTAGTRESEGRRMKHDADAYWSSVPAWELLSSPTGAPAATLARAAGVGGPVRTVSTACSSSTQALGLAARAVRSGRLPVAIAGGTDSLCQLTLAGFGALRLLDPAGCRPFDARRAGTALGEGAAMFVIEAASRARARGARPLAVLAGWGAVAEAHHPVQPEPDGAGARRCIEAALADAGLPASAVDYVNAHGTATPANDVAEARALHAVFGQPPPASSTKSQIGHLLGAAGAVEAAATVAALTGGFLPPTAGWAAADPEIDLDVVPTARPAAVGVALSTSFAFGGNDACLVLAHPEAL